MKKITLLLCAVLCLVLGAQAQQKVQIGIRLGGNYANFTGSNADSLDLEGVWGGHGGLIITVPVLKNNIAVKTDIIYSMKGAKSADDSLDIDLGYIDMPILAQFRAGPLYLEGGPQPAFKVKSDIKDERNRSDLKSFADNFRKTSLSYAVGAGFVIPSVGLNLGVRYNGDISNLVNNINDKEFRNSVLMFTTSYGF